MRRLSAQPAYNSMLRTTCVATQLKGGHAPNALPQLARANVNCRVLPEHDIKDVQATLVRLAGDTAVHVSPAPEPRGGPASPLTDEVLRPIETTDGRDVARRAGRAGHGHGRDRWPAAATGGIPTYGVSGLFGDMDDSRAHGRDERMLIKSFYRRPGVLYGS